MIELPADHNEEYLFLRLIHEISEKFSNHAILRGGMVLRLLGSARKTLDLDYTFVPFKSKKEVMDDLKQLCLSIQGATLRASVNSKIIHLIIKTKNVQIQLEVNVSEDCKSVPISTKELSKKFGISPKVIRIMSYEVSLANKLAAWFERRLVRDLYDIHYLSSVAGPQIDLPTLQKRLGKVESRIPKLKKITKVSLSDFFSELESVVTELNEKMIRAELSSFIEEDEFPGLDLIIRKSVLELIRKYQLY